MRGLATKKFVKETCNWRVVYWTLNDDGIAYLREKLALPADAVPSTLKELNRSAAVKEEAKQFQGRRGKKEFHSEKKPEFKN